MSSPSRPMSDDKCYFMKYVAGTVLCLVGVAVGLHLPDVDRMMQIPLLFVHRSIVSHSFLLPLLLFGMVRAAQAVRREGPTTQLSHPHADPELRLFALGLCAALAVHFCFDLFPNRWYGYATVHVPLLGRLPGPLSFAWLASSALMCLYIGSRLLCNLFDLLLVVGCLGGAFGLAAAYEPNIALYALFALVVLAPIAFVLHGLTAKRKSA